MRPAVTPSIGVDLVETKKAAAFYRRHRRRLDSFFNSSETRYLRSGRGVSRRLAELLAAKEALFKARGGAWMGVSGFSDLALGLRGGKLRPAGADARRFRLAFVRGTGYVIARCESIVRGNPARGTLAGLRALGRG